MATNEQVIPTDVPADVKTFKILLDGEEIKESYQIESLIVHKEVNKLPFARVTIIDGNAAEQNFAISDSGEFDPGKTIEIQAGYNSDDKTIFKGVIIRQGVKIGKRKNSVLKIEAKDEFAGLSIGRKNRYFYELKDSEIIEDILAEHKKDFQSKTSRSYSLSNAIKATELEHDEMVQYYCSDWDFIISRAEQNGLLVMVNDGEFKVDAPDLSQDVSASLAYGSTIYEFESELDATGQFGKVESTSWDLSSTEATEPIDSEEPKLGDQGIISGEDLSKVLGTETFEQFHTGNVVDQELQVWSDSRMLKARLARLRGRVKCQGFSGVLPGSIIELKGVGEHYSGKVFVSGVRHLISGENWEMDIQFGMRENWFQKEDVVEDLASGMLPGINGLHIGLVTQIESDPDSEFRLLVRMPLMGQKTDDGVWARVALLDAGDNRGTFFRPELGDEVVLGFLNGDPRDPIVLGSLHSSSKPSPIEPSDDNHEKGIVTRSDMRLTFNDEDKIIRIQTADDKNIIRIDEKDQGIFIQDEHNNKIEMNSDGITITSASDLTLSATGDIIMEAANIKGAANAEVKIEGNGGAELSTSGVAVLKGSVVQIN